MEKLTEQDREGALSYIRDACGVRSPTTVLKRAKDLQQFVNWRTKMKRTWWPMQERCLLDFLSSCEREGRSKFIGKNFLHAVKFFKYVMGANFALEAVVGPLLQGRVLRVLSTRDPVHQARALTVEEVRQLEEMVESDLNVLDRYFAGCPLFALYSRARWSDLASMQSFFFDTIETADGPFGFVGGRTWIHKTSNTVEKKAFYHFLSSSFRSSHNRCEGATMGIGLAEGFGATGAAACDGTIWPHLQSSHFGRRFHKETS